jgi:alpha-tubulin suppressor-like RCC1 family protein
VPGFVKLTGATMLAAGAQHTCAVVAGAMKCWGRNTFGQLGDHTVDDAFAAVDARGVRDIVAIAAGGGSNTTLPTGLLVGTAHTCAVIAGGQIQCWGFNGYGQLGSGSSENAFDPTLVVGLSGASNVTAGLAHTCALVAGIVYCWGSNRFGGQLGNGSDQDSLRPTKVTGVAGATAIAAGLDDTCAIVAGGAVICWGYHAKDGREMKAGITGATSIMSSPGGHSCAIVADGKVLCWGDNTSGQLGDGKTSPDPTSKPVAVIGLTGATAIAGGARHSCAIVANGNVSCWGDNAVAQLGDGTSNNSLHPVPVAGVTAARAISAGEFHTCALVEGGAIKCWGDDSDGQLGGIPAVSPTIVDVMVLFTAQP